MRSEFQEHSESLFLSSSYIFESAESIARQAANSEKGFYYSRFSNPTVSMFQERLASLEGAQACIATASGMSAILTLLLSTLKTGDHVIASQSLFGSTIQMLSAFLPRVGVETTFVPLTDVSAWQQAIQGNTKLLFLETPSNPLMEIGDIQAIANVAHEKGVLLVVDNTFCSPAIQNPIRLGADVVIHSATKLIDGQGRVLGGAILGRDKFIKETIFPFVRLTGPTLSAFNAWVLLKGLETLQIRLNRQSESALELARWLETIPEVDRVFYPGLPSHPQHLLAGEQQRSGGSVVSFQVRGHTPEAQRNTAWSIMDRARLFSRTANLGDVKSTILHPASTIHSRITPNERALAGITEGLVRLSIGLEDPIDLKSDLLRGLNG
ncbi:O-succinylhomoserine sulfhydrylase [Variovorax sp. V35]